MTAERGDVITEREGPRFIRKKVVEGTQNGCVNLHRTSTMLELILLRSEQPSHQEWIPIRLVGGKGLLKS
jgi:hypothetical protein